MCLIINTGILVSPIYDRTMSRILRMPLFRLPRCAKSLRLRLALTGGVEAIEMHNLFQKVDNFQGE
jgi:hypothetical protein